MPCRTFVMRSLPKAKLVYFLLVQQQGCRRGGTGDMWTYKWNAQFVGKLKKKTSIVLLTLCNRALCITLTALSSAINIAVCPSLSVCVCTWQLSLFLFKTKHGLVLLIIYLIDVMCLCNITFPIKSSALTLFFRLRFSVDEFIGKL